MPLKFHTADKISLMHKYVPRRKNTHTHSVFFVLVPISQSIDVFALIYTPTTPESLFWFGFDCCGQRWTYLQYSAFNPYLYKITCELRSADTSESCENLLWFPYPKAAEFAARVVKRSCFELHKVGHAILQKAQMQSTNAVAGNPLICVNFKNTRSQNPGGTVETNVYKYLQTHTHTHLWGQDSNAYIAKTVNYSFKYYNKSTQRTCLQAPYTPSVNHEKVP